jgi:hypothetical protein
LLVLAVGLLAALCAILFQRQKDRSSSYGRKIKRSQYHGIPTNDLDEDAFSFQDEGINLIDGNRIVGGRSDGKAGGGLGLKRSESLSSVGDVLIDTQFGGSSESDIDLSEDDMERGNIADMDDFRVYKADVEFDLELSDDDETGFAGW